MLVEGDALPVHRDPFWVLIADVTGHADHPTHTVPAGNVVMGIVQVVLPEVFLGRIANVIRPAGLQENIVDLKVNVVMDIVQDVLQEVFLGRIVNVMMPVDHQEDIVDLRVNVVMDIV